MVIVVPGLMKLPCHGPGRRRVMPRSFEKGWPATCSTTMAQKEHFGTSGGVNDLLGRSGQEFARHRALAREEAHQLRTAVQVRPAVKLQGDGAGLAAGPDVGQEVLQGKHPRADRRVTVLAIAEVVGDVEMTDPV